MKRVFYLITIFLALIFTFSCCTNKPKRSRKPVSNIIIEPQKIVYTYGEKVTIKVITKLKNGELENSKLYFSDQLLKEDKSLEFTVESVTLDQLGNQTFSVLSTKTDGIDNRTNKMIKVVSNTPSQLYTYRVLNAYNHDKNSFTQGLEFYNGFLYEGIGEYGTSAVLKTDYKTAKILQSKKMADQYFGEGITILNDKIYQLTYKAQKGFVYDLKTFAVIDSFRYQSKEGWGLTNDGTNLIMSDGTHTLQWINPETFKVIKKIQVSNSKGIINYLNELEYVDGAIYANIYTTNIIVKIDSKTGKVLQEINMSGLLDNISTNEDKIDYFNGIAFNKKNNTMFVTGKLWPKLYEVEFIPLK